MGALKVEYLIIVITSFLLHANNVYITMYFVGSLYLSAEEASLPWENTKNGMLLFSDRYDK